VSPEVFDAFARMTQRCPSDGDILEIGATPTPDTLLALPRFQAARSRIGLDLAGPHETPGFRILAGQANAMSMFEAARFDVVLCNSMLEHDARFWLTLAEIRRVIRPGGHFLVGVPGYGPMGTLRGAGASSPAWLEATAPTLGLHDFPGDYYRFSQQAVTEVFLEGFDAVDTVSVMLPPRFIAHGIRRQGDAAFG
jgi:SAM-dependent methyltransferase